MSKHIVSISKHPKYCSKGQRSRQRLFNLGRHWYSGAPGLSWVTNYWVKKIQKGTLWELYCSQEESLSYREYCGTFEAEELRDYFEEVGFELDEEQWLEIGLGRGAELLATPMTWHIKITERIYEVMEQELCFQSQSERSTSFSE